MASMHRTATLQLEDWLGYWPSIVRLGTVSRATSGRAPGRTRTCDLVIRSDLLCPTELRRQHRKGSGRPLSQTGVLTVVRPHHTKDKGDLGVAHAIGDLADQGFVVLTALTEHAPFDLVGYRRGRFVRVQVEYRSLSASGTLEVQFRSSWSDSRGIRVRPLESTTSTSCVSTAPTRRPATTSIRKRSHVRCPQSHADSQSSGALHPASRRVSTSTRLVVPRPLIKPRATHVEPGREGPATRLKGSKDVPGGVQTVARTSRSP